MSKINYLYKKDKVFKLKRYLKKRLFKPSDLYRSGGYSVDYLYGSEHGFLCHVFPEYKYLWQSMVTHASLVGLSSRNRSPMLSGMKTVKKTNNFRLLILATIISLPTKDIISWFDEMDIPWELLGLKPH